MRQTQFGAKYTIGEFFLVMNFEPFARAAAGRPSGSDPRSAEEDWYHLGIHHKINRKSSSSHQQPPPSTSAQYSLEPSLHEVMRRLDRHERLLLHQSRQIANTQLMIRQAFPETDFTGLERISSDDSSESAEF
ncbi:hypothetical protein PIB30_099963 [Stylosanthes scabra]|uniref:Uncharacterized protein n=1 Tax=Stylosanthes scabra TaxID=79078 RepID=A0ABU6TWH3_9FABA|nr:hypothetical protein [Stylosanthes scabra]